MFLWRDRQKPTKYSIGTVSVVVEIITQVKKPFLLIQVADDKLEIGYHDTRK
jgi:hypothetical protein